MAKRPREIRLPALEIRQGPKRVLYTFAVNGKLIPEFAAISRINRAEDHQVNGYQRPEVLSHIAEIRQYLESPNPMIPNAIVIAFDSRIRFVPGPVGLSSDYSRAGTLVIPVDPALSDDQKPGWIVDGQQRVAAIREAKVNDFPICVVSFVTKQDHEQREQFILVNSTKPLPKGLIYELLPTTQARLSSILERRRFPAMLLDRLNYDDDSPLLELIKTPTTPNGIIRDNSLLKMLENSLSDGVLYRFRDPETDEPDTDTMLGILKSFWGATRRVFHHAWRKPPRQSRLMHGAGIVSMGLVMDAISERHRDQGVPGDAEFEKDLRPLHDVCRWTDGYWDFGPGTKRKWNEIQNTSKDIQLLANYLLVQYKELVWNVNRPSNNRAGSRENGRARKK